MPETLTFTGPIVGADCCTFCGKEGARHADEADPDSKFCHAVCRAEFFHFQAEDPETDDDDRPRLRATARDVEDEAIGELVEGVMHAGDPTQIAAYLADKPVELISLAMIRGPGSHGLVSAHLVTAFRARNPPPPMAVPADLFGRTAEPAPRKLPGATPFNPFGRSHDKHGNPL